MKNSRLKNKKLKALDEEGQVRTQEEEFEEGESKEDDMEEEEESDEFADAYLAGFKSETVVDSSTTTVDGKDLARAGRDAGSAAAFFSWLIHPVPLETFYEEYWEKRPLLIRRPERRNYYDGWFCKADLELLLQKKQLEYGKHLDVAVHREGQRSTPNGEGIADPADVWARFSEGCSLRLLHPQRWSDSLWLMLSTLERHWNCIAGCNVYLTPPASQGFSPHFDDIDAFILQTEGAKWWRCYPPASPDAILPRFSSPNMSQEELPAPALEATLEPGDMLYMPRGTIHQAVSVKHKSSLHLTVSTGQRNTWTDFLELALPRALELAAEEHPELRESLPRDVFSFMGVVHSDENEDVRRAEFKGRILGNLKKVFESGPWDAAVDQLAIKFLKQRLPVWKGSSKDLFGGQEAGAEAKHEHQGSKEKRRKKAGEELVAEAVMDGGKVKQGSRVRLAVAGNCRLVLEEGSFSLFHFMDNEREKHAERQQEEEEEEEEEEAASDGEEEGGADGDRMEGNGSGAGGGGGEGEDEGGEAERVALAGAEGEYALVESGRVEFPLEYAEVLEQLVLMDPGESVAVRELRLRTKKARSQLAEVLLGAGVLQLVD